MSSDDLVYICTLLKEARAKSLDNCNYESSLSIFETVQKLLNKAFLNSAPELAEKVSRLRDVCRCESKLLKDYINEKNKFVDNHVVSHRPQKSEKEDAPRRKESDDPDIWPPPTPAPNAGRERALMKVDNKNAWGIEKKETPAPRPRVVQRGNEEVNQRIEQMKKERDAVDRKK